MSGQIYRPGASYMETAFSRLLDAAEYEAPMSPVAEDPYSSPPQTYPGCFGLPYQDHNYGAPPPLTQSPPPVPPPAPPTTTTKESFDVKEEIVVTSDLLSSAQPITMPPEPSIEDEIDDPTRCICDFVHDDGYMIQCDKCSVWQHIVCMGLDRESIPDTYFCEQCHQRPVDRVRAREFQIRKREFLKTLVITSHDSSATDTDPEEVNNRLKAYGLDTSLANKDKPKQKVKVKKRKDRTNARNLKKMKLKEVKIEKENTNKELNKKHKLMVRDFASKTAQAKKEKLTKKIEKMRAERISKEMRDDKLGCEDIKDDERMINTTKTKTVPSPVVQDENAQVPWDINTFNEWEQSYEVAKYNQYTTYVQEYLNSTYMNGHHNEIADLVTDGLRVQRCHIKELRNKKKGLESSFNIPNGQPVIEVIGKIMTRHQYDKDNFGQRQLSPFVFFYGKVFDLDLVIDASDYGNDARFIRRSCQPNSEVRHVVAGGQAHFITVATKDISEHTEITIPFDFDYKKWNYCVECACLRNSCPILRYQKRRLRFQKLQIGDRTYKKNSRNEKNLKLNMKSPPVKSPIKSPVKSQVQTPEKIEEDSLSSAEVSSSPGTETIHVNQPEVSPVKMVRRSQVAKQTTVSTQISTGRVKSIRVPSQCEDSSVNEPLTTPEPATLRCSEVDSLTSPEIKDNNSKKDEEATGPEKKKMTREERKMEAIMKAFEKMEKRNARKTSVDQYSKVKENDTEKVKGKGKEKAQEKEEVKKEKEIKQEPEPEEELIIKEEVKEERVVVPEVIVQVQPTVETKPEEITDIKEAIHVTEEETQVLPTPPQIREKSAKGKKSRKTTARRRTRNCSGASGGASGPELTAPPTPVDEIPIVSAPPALPAMSISCPVTPCEGPATPPSFRFVKTKRHLMNEWYSEKVTDAKQAIKSEPLEVSVADDSMFVTCLPSPHNSMDKLRRNSQSNGSRDRFGGTIDNSVGSAKKRWLRQAMGEGSSESGLSSPVPQSGGMSPNPQMAMPSPGGSPPVDFVTPLKKRRLARESLSRESFASESPTPTPTPTPSLSSEPPIPNYFSGLSETFESKIEEIRLKNGISSYFSINSTEEDEEKEETIPAPESTDSLTEAAESFEDQVKPSEPAVLDHSIVESSMEKEGDINCVAEVNCSSAGNAGTEEMSPEGEQISEHVSSPSVDVDGDQTVHCEQSESVCDVDSKSANNSEPDSSESVCAKSEGPIEVECGPMETECDSVCTETSQTPSTNANAESEVDSTESSVSISVLPVTNSSTFSSSDVINSSPVSVVEPCDSCSSAGKLNSPYREQRPRTNSSDKACSSTSSIVQEFFAKTESTNNGLFHSPEKLSMVDSSTDQTVERRNSISNLRRNLHSPVVQDSMLSVSDSSLNENKSPLENKNEVTNSTDEASSLSHLPPHNFVQILSLNDSFSSTNSLTPEPSNFPNRHLKFLNDSNYGTEMTVDSTTHIVSSASSAANCLQINSSSVVLYDSDSMDVSSASEAGINGILEDKRIDDSLSNYLESSSSSCESSQQPKEKKRVSLQEYLKRKKDKPSTPVLQPKQQTLSVSKPSSVSSTVTTPNKLINPAAVLEKLQPLPSLPSLPMFEKTERKEFKSSSDLLSPIFNRKEKQEEVRKPMSLSERLRQEFGVDDDIDTDSGTDNNKNDVMDTDEGTDIPPPPPPPPPQNTGGMRVAQMKAGPVPNGNSIPPLMSLKPYPSQTVTKPPQNSSNALAVGSATGTNSNSLHMVPPPNTTPVKVQSPASKLSLSSPIPAQLGNLLASIKSPAQLKNDLNASLAALKAQISKVQQQTVPNSPSPSSSGPAVFLDQASSSASTTSKQVFDYGHQSSSNFSRQNSFPSSSSNHYQTYSKASSSVGFNNKTSPAYNRVSPRYSKVSPPSGSQPYNSQTFNSHFNNKSPPLRNQKQPTSQKHSMSVSSTSRKHKYL